MTQPEQFPQQGFVEPQYQYPQPRYPQYEYPQSQYPQYQQIAGYPDQIQDPQKVLVQTPNPYFQQVPVKGNFGWAVLGFFVPMAGLVLWLVWKDTNPPDSRQSRNGFIASLIAGAVFFVLYIVLILVMFASMGI